MFARELMPKVAMTSKETPHKYRALDPSKNEIRVLRVLSGEDSGRVRCSLDHIILDDSALYEAISYAWHDSSIFLQERRQAVERIQIGDQYVSIGLNLLAFLKSIRSASKDSSLYWIDAVCIDQSSLSERNTQVLRMQQIYSKARRVIVWLGPEHGSSTKAVDFLRFVSSNCPVNHEAEWFAVLLKSPQVGMQWNALTRLLWRVWWSRIWIVQEVILAKDIVVICGGASISWTDLEYAMTNINEALTDKWNQVQIFGGLSLIRDRIKAVVKLAESRRRKHELSPLKVIDRVGGNDCSNARDKIYGLLGIIADADRMMPLPDYTRSPENVYRNFFVWLAQRTGQLDFLSLVHNRLDDSNRSTLPTWCPDLRARDYRSTPRLSTTLLLCDDEIPQFSASGTKKSSAKSSRDKTSLTVLGISIDTIDGVFPGGFDNHLTLKYTTQAKSNVSAYEDDHASFVALWHSFIGGMNLESKTKDHTPPVGFAELFIESCCAAEEEHLKLCEEGKETIFDIVNPLKHPVFLDDDVVRPFNTWYKYNRSAKFAGKSIKDWVTSNISVPSEVQVEVVTPVKELPLFTAFRNSWSNACAARRLATTEKGYIGTVPELTRKGDIVCVLFGCSMPVVLRPKDKHFLFIGDAYIHGLMNGEAIGEFMKGQQRVQEFELH